MCKTFHIYCRYVGSEGISLEILSVELMHPSVCHGMETEENQTMGFEGKKNLH